MSRMKHLKKILIAALLLTLLSFNFPHSNYKRLPYSYNDESYLIKYAHPDKDYTYWEFDSTFPDGVIYSYGTKQKDIKFKSISDSKLFIGCKPMLCSEYIAYVCNGNVGYVTNAEELKNFIGKIDNLQEAVLLARAIYDLRIDANIKGGVYRIHADTVYDLRLTKFISCPETKKIFYLKIERNKGIVDTATEATFYKGTGCLVY